MGTDLSAAWCISAMLKKFLGIWAGCTIAAQQLAHKASMETLVRVAQTLNHERHMVKYVMALLYAAEIRVYAKNVET